MNETRDNPKKRCGDQKAPLSCVPAMPLYLIGLGMLEGALKYGRHNYRETPVDASTYYDAAMRHLTAWWEGEDTDPESKLPHLAKAACCLVILMDAGLNVENLIDDRPPPSRAGWQEDVNMTSSFLREDAESEKELREHRRAN